MTLNGCTKLISEGLEKKLGCPVIPSQNVSKRMQYPFCYYDVVSPTCNDKDGLKTFDGKTLTRQEPSDAFMTFTFCGMNRMKDGYCVFGDEECQKLAEIAHGYFLLEGHNLETPDGSDIVIRSVDEATKADDFEADEFIRHSRITIRFGYIRTDEREQQRIDTITFKGTARNKADIEAQVKAVVNSTAESLINDLLKGFEGLK